MLDSRLRGNDGKYVANYVILNNCPHGQPGDQLWVRECFGYIDPDCSGEDFENENGGQGPCTFRAELLQEGHPLREFWRRRIAYAATFEEQKYGNGPDAPERWRPSIHMPRWASRIQLGITGVRVERLQDISEADCICEGITGDEIKSLGPCGHPFDRVAARGLYTDLWEDINGSGSWDANPWVWVIEFKLVKP